MVETHKHMKPPRGWESVQFGLCEFLSKELFLQQGFGGKPSLFLSPEYKKNLLCPLWLSQRFYCTVNRRSKIIHLKSDGYSSELHLVFKNAQKSWLRIWFLFASRWCWQLDLSDSGKGKLLLLFSISLAKVWQPKHRRRPNTPASAQTGPKTSYFIPLLTHCLSQPPYKPAFAHGWYIFTAVALWRDEVKGLWSAVSLRLLPEAHLHTCSTRQCHGGLLKNLYLTLLNTTCTSGRSLPTRRQQGWTDTGEKPVMTMNSSQGEAEQTADRSCQRETSARTSIAISRGKGEWQMLLHCRRFKQHQKKASSKFEINTKEYSSEWYINSWWKLTVQARSIAW